MYTRHTSYRFIFNSFICKQRVINFEKELTSHKRKNLVIQRRSLHPFSSKGKMANKIGKYHNAVTYVGNGFLPGVPVNVESCTKENECFDICLKHGDFEWVVTKPEQELLSLAASLKKEGFFRILRRRFPDLPVLGQNFEAEDLKLFCSAVLASPVLRESENVMKFFQVSKFSFIKELGNKGIEGPIIIEMKDSDGCLKSWYNHWYGGITRWTVLKDNCMIFMDEKTKQVSGVVQVDHEFGIDYDPDDDPTQITINSSLYTATGRCATAWEAAAWKVEADKVIALNKWGLAKLNSRYSFAPVRTCHANWFVDGHSYFDAVADALEQAQEQIFITDWCITPTIHLKRNCSDRLYWRLDNVLKRKAEQGVHVHIIVYKEVEGTVANESREAKEYFMGLHENITVQLHPEFSLTTAIWSNHEKLVIVDQNTAFVGGIDLCYNRYDLPSHPLQDDVCDSQGFPCWVGKDYNSLYTKDRLNLEPTTKERDEEYRQNHPRTPWHDVASVTYGNSAKDVTRHFIQRWNFVKNEQCNTNLPHIIPKVFDESFNLEMPHGTMEAKVQVLRSSSTWTSGHNYTECSIHNAYIELIEKAEKFIYIENQFFISNTKETKNKIVEALYKRILKAHVAKENFKVYIVIPLLPSAENDIRYDATSQTIQAILGFEYMSINRAEGALLTLLESAVDNVDQYVTICSLMSHGRIGGRLKSEILYVHSKLLVVDDRYTIIGSANVNDRSQVGDRDSEMCLLIEDTKFVKSTMDNEDYQVGVFSQGVRKRCFAEVLGLLPTNYNHENDFEPTRNIDDVLTNEFYNDIWKKTAHSNTELFEKIFGIVPSNRVRDFKQESLDAYQSKQIKSEELIEKEVKKIKGHLIEFPLHALEDEDLTPDFGSKEYLAPDVLFI